MMDDSGVGGGGVVEDVVAVVAKPPPTTKQQFFSFLSRRSKNQIEPGGTHTAAEDPELPNAGDLFRCSSSTTTTANHVLSNGNHQAEHTNSLKKSLLQPRGPFALCCTADGRAMTPVIVRYNSDNNNTTTTATTTGNKSSGGVHTTIRPPPRRSHSNYKDNLAYESETFERRFYSPPPPPPVAEPSERPRSRKIQVLPCDEEAMDTLNELKSCPNYSPTTFDRRPMYAEYYQQNTYNSIAMSACKSRLREKLLPPQVSQVQDKVPQQQQQQPNGADIYSVTSADEGSSQDNLVNNNNSNNINCGGSPSLPVHCEASSGRSHNNNNNCQRPASTDSLARQALMAAQVLHLIPTERARARSIAHGNTANNNTLLGMSELNRVLPNREVKVFVGTWNMNGEPPPM